MWQGHLLHDSVNHLFTQVLCSALPDSRSVRAYRRFTRLLQETYRHGELIGLTNDARCYPDERMAKRTIVQGSGPQLRLHEALNRVV